MENDQPLMFEDVQDEYGNDLLVTQAVAAMSPEDRAKSRENIDLLVQQLQATARPIQST